MSDTTRIGGDGDQEFTLEDFQKANPDLKETNTSKIERSILKLIVDDYEVLESIKGGMAIVLKVINNQNKRIEALKVLKLENSKNRKELIKRFFREIKTCAKIKQEYPDISIPKIFSSQAKNQNFFYTMEFIDGSSLEKIMKQKLPLKQAVEMIIELSKILEVLHKNGIVHRDIKPANIIRDKNNRLWLVDFGIVKKTHGAETTCLTASGFLLGTPKYMSPEQTRGEEDIDQRSDLYALGAILYEMIAGRPVADVKGLEEVIKAICCDPVKFPDSLEIPEELKAVCLKALEKDRNSRYQDVVSLRQDLQKISL